jgi:hypothetical protein
MHQDKELPKIQGRRAPDLLVSPSRKGRLLVHQGSLKKAHPREATQWQAAPDGQAPDYGNSLRVVAMLSAPTYMIKKYLTTPRRRTASN